MKREEVCKLIAKWLSHLSKGNRLSRFNISNRPDWLKKLSKGHHQLT